MPFGEKHAKLKAVKIHPKLWSYLMATVDKTDGYDKADETTWQLMAKTV